MRESDIAARVPRNRVRAAAAGVGIAALVAAATAWAGTMIGTPTGDVLKGSQGNDKIYGKAGNEGLYGYGGNDSWSAVRVPTCLPADRGAMLGLPTSSTQ